MPTVGEDARLGELMPEVFVFPLQMVLVDPLGSKLSVTRLLLPLAAAKAPPRAFFLVSAAGDAPRAPDPYVEENERPIATPPVLDCSIFLLLLGGAEVLEMPKPYAVSATFLPLPPFCAFLPYILLSSKSESRFWFLPFRAATASLLASLLIAAASPSAAAN